MLHSNPICGVFNIGVTLKTSTQLGFPPNLNFHQTVLLQVNRDVHFVITIPLYLILGVRLGMGGQCSEECIISHWRHFPMRELKEIVELLPHPLRWIQGPRASWELRPSPGKGTSSAYLSSYSIIRHFSETRCKFSARWFKPAGVASMLVSVDFSCHRFFSDVYTTPHHTAHQQQTDAKPNAPHRRAGGTATKTAKENWVGSVQEKLAVAGKLWLERKKKPLRRRGLSRP